MYESEATRFLKEFLAKNPQVAAQRPKLRATWWDRPQDPQTQREHEASDAPASSYVYFPPPKP
ncbi:DUF3460 family protein [Usitatibacter palustris]|jgi:hypothetical protein|uniref:DUF3460 domain-containing protein n=1 Tax=Usitatibacter palustris TaxID=2732487 RepID=A0A6M4H7R1_9PROT|nr:DUF3460 family protein [Usitatibacter palustris]QJR14414.1 hypothetical protein DSM104440_01210 [Usitatibacter palustris]